MASDSEGFPPGENPDGNPPKPAGTGGAFHTYQTEESDPEKAVNPGAGTGEQSVQANMTNSQGPGYGQSLFQNPDNLFNQEEPENDLSSQPGEVKVGGGLPSTYQKEEASFAHQPEGNQEKADDPPSSIPQEGGSDFFSNNDDGLFSGSKQ